MMRTGHKQIRIQAEVIHTGYALGQHDLRKKYEPRLALLEYELEHAENEKFRSYYSYQLGVSMFVLRDLEKALAPEVDSLKRYQKNQFDDDPYWMDRVYDELRDAFDRFGYEKPQRPAEAEGAESEPAEKAVSSP